jgi:hypothetical protein
MTVSLDCHLKPEWPPLAWLARCVDGSPTIHLSHGRMVEVQDSSFCEAVWDGSYGSRDFDLTDVVFGSAGRARDGGFAFVSSGSTNDRLQSLATNDATWVSNSLPCLLSSAGATVAVTYDGYYDDFESIVDGLHRYKPTLETSAGPVRLTYFHNLRWDGHVLTEQPKPNIVRDFSTFSLYRTFLESKIEELAANGAAGGRKYPYQLLATLSSGYDSPAVAVLARKAGLSEAISFASGRGGHQDDGREIGKILGIRVALVSRDAWHSKPFAEVPFIAADAKGEDVHFAGVEDALMGRVLLTGFHGSTWSKNLHPVDANIVRRDQSGLSLTEYRLSAGFIHVPVAFLGARQLRDIHAICQSSEMAPWDVGGQYNRPIARRIVEESGVPRGKFAATKKAASVLFFERDSFLLPDSLRDFKGWLTDHAEEWSTLKRLPPARAAALSNVGKPFLRMISAGTRMAVAIVPQKYGWRARALHERVMELEREEYLFRYVFPWAMERAKSRY